MIHIPAKIRRMSRRRQKVAIKRGLQHDLENLVSGKPNSPLVRAEVTRAILNKFAPDIRVDISVQPQAPAEKIKFSFVVT